MSDNPNPLHKTSKISAWISHKTDRALAFWHYASNGVWRDTRSNWRINLLKTLNITVRSFLDTDLQSQACALTYRTVLAIVPALALVFAICRDLDSRIYFRINFIRLYRLSIRPWRWL